MTTSSEQHSKIQPEIQFLRALAVLLVVLSHSKFSIWSGGFVGVDMFFVVSGYVICLSLIHERNQSNINSLKRFFQRRFFRIFPPLVATIVGSCVYAYLILPFDRSQDYFIEQARSALFSYANFFFHLSQDGLLSATSQLHVLLTYLVAWNRRTVLHSCSDIDCRHWIQ